ncbi:MAG: GNAT family N-acetyltransferase [Acidobacteriota bacterium]
MSVCPTDGAGWQDCEILKWDSEFFGFPVARITCPVLSHRPLSRILRALAQTGAKLIYWPTSSAIEQRDPVLQSHNGRLVDVKTTYAIDLSRDVITEAGATFGIRSYGIDAASPDLISLAIQAGEHSRFAVDPLIPRNKFEELYTIWIKKSVDKTLADDVLVAASGGAITGMITVGRKGSRGDIGLVAVDREWRGRKLGEALVRAALRWFARNNLERVQVVTQGSNAGANRLYAKCGFSIEKQEYYYHFWP